MNSNEIFKENNKIQQVIEKILEERFSKVNESINLMSISLDNYIEEESLKNTKNQKEMEYLLNSLCYEFGDLLNKSKFINESIILKNNLIQYKFTDLDFKIMNPPSVVNIDANINYISILTRKFYDVIQIKYQNKSDLFKAKLGFMHFSYNRILNERLLSKDDNILLEYVDIILKLEFIKYLYSNLSNILLCINCNYID